MALRNAFDAVRRYVEDASVPAAVLAVADAREMLRCEAFGRPGGDVVTTDSTFWIASVTKPIFATAVMQLVVEGRLDLDEPVQPHLPEFQPPPAGNGLPGGEAVTARHLLAHTSGATDTPREVLESERPDADGLYRRVCERRLAFAPGTRYLYASDSYYVLGELIARLTGVAYPDHLDERVFRALGMTSTSFDPFTAPERMAPLHGLGYEGPMLQLAIAYVASLAAPGGGLWSTAGDLVRFGQAYLGAGRLGAARVLDEHHLALMTQEQTEGVFEEESMRSPHYGLGWGLPGLGGTIPGAESVFGHGGATGSYLWVDPANQLVIAFLMNRWGDDGAAALAAIHAVYGALGPSDGR